ncbi:hypothetical protein O1611_g9136 [Lasiodiplodia mahajangana]|uniref:Uncharacterized protein n=1 Tax=Lasiodiplodia mahajangana TaxID=1108764 RepID=A0ACC2JAK9_9PEZI|nr:hypothetical protein O1611_g9136 [Lasiodiplodia mahajangana]
MEWFGFTGSSTTTTTSGPTSTATTTTSAAATTTAGAGAAHYAQCGGIGWTGATTGELCLNQHLVSPEPIYSQLVMAKLRRGLYGTGVAEESIKPTLIDPEPLGVAGPGAMITRNPTLAVKGAPGAGMTARSVEKDPGDTRFREKAQAGPELLNGQEGQT